MKRISIVTNIYKLVFMLIYYFLFFTMSFCINKLPIISFFDSNISLLFKMFLTNNSPCPRFFPLVLIFTLPILSPSILLANVLLIIISTLFFIKYTSIPSFLPISCLPLLHYLNKLLLFLLIV